MKFTNKAEMPELMYRALTGGISSDVGEMDFNMEIGKISVTTLAAPVRMVILRARHTDEIEEDVSDRLWLLMGNGVHKAFERVWVPNVLQETRLKVVRMVEDQRSVPVRWEISGRADVSMVKEDANRLLIDWKVGSVYGYLLRRDGEDEPQLNMYAMMMQNIWGIEFDYLRVWLIMRDWMESKRGTEGYPAIPFAEINVKRWTPQQVEEWLSGRLKMFMANAALPDDELVHCTKEETWERDPSYAVMKPGRKSAVRVFETSGAASAWIVENSKPTEKMTVVKRPGQRPRCERFCKAEPFCNQYREYRQIFVDKSAE